MNSSDKFVTLLWNFYKLKVRLRIPDAHKTCIDDIHKLIALINMQAQLRYNN